VTDETGRVTDGGPWRGPTEKEWVVRIAAPSTPVGESIPWIIVVDVDRTQSESVEDSQKSGAL
jgi:hypothetical protein